MLAAATGLCSCKDNILFEWVFIFVIGGSNYKLIVEDFVITHFNNYVL